MFDTYSMKPIKFHPYPSSVHIRVLKLEYSSTMPEVESIKEELLLLFNEAGIKARDDNKIVFEAEYDGKRIFYGFYDWVFSIGFGVYTKI